MTDALNVALVGYGDAGKVFHAPLITHTPGLHLHTVVSSDASKVHADFPDVHVVAEPRQAFADDAIDLVVIASPNTTHATLAIAALDAGRHVLVDKPFATSLADARCVLDAAARNGCIATAFQNRRLDGDFLTLRALVEDGTLGDVVELHSHFDRFRPQPRERWREREGAGAGLWFDLGPHLVDQALQLFGLPLAVQADIAVQRERAVVDDWFHVVLRYARRRVVLHAGTLVAAPGARFAAHGTRGSFITHGLDPQEAMLRDGMQPGATGWRDMPQSGRLVTVDAEGAVGEREVECMAGDYRALYAGVRDAIRDGAALPVTPQQVIDVMRVLETGITSAREGRVVRLD